MNRRTTRVGEGLPASACLCLPLPASACLLDGLTVGLRDKEGETATSWDSATVKFDFNVGAVTAAARLPLRLRRKKDRKFVRAAFTCDFTWGSMRVGGTDGWMSGWMDEWLDGWMMSLPLALLEKRMCQSFLQYSRPRRLIVPSFPLQSSHV